MGNRKPILPNVMRGSARWVAWKPVLRRGRWSKMPIQTNGSPASSTNPRTWTSFDAVKDFPRRGWVLGEGIGCIDLDDCIRDGQIASWALAVLEEYKRDAVWIEVSPSGAGVHVFVPMGTGKGTVIRDGRNIEVYPPDSGRFICVTGDHLCV